MGTSDFEVGWIGVRRSLPGARQRVVLDRRPHSVSISKSGAPCFESGACWPRQAVDGPCRNFRPDAAHRATRGERPGPPPIPYHGLSRPLLALDKTGGDTGSGAPMGIGGLRIARLSTGGVMAAVDAVMTGTVRQAYALVRPPGHHAMAHEGMGFCIFNNVVIAARHARAMHGVRRVAVVDWDVHHGNGTQSAFYEQPDELFVSLHQDSLYPNGWGTVDQVGEGAGEGRTVNIPLPAGSGNATYRAAFERIVVPVIEEFAPELIFVSAGQDASVCRSACAHDADHQRISSHGWHHAGSGGATL